MNDFKWIKVIETTEHTTMWEIIMSVFLGIGLAAACGFRIFLPMFLASLASYFAPDMIPMGETFAWVGSIPAMITFGAATALEIFAYYIPWFDNLLDTIAVPLATIAGSVVAIAMIGDVDAWIRWPLAIIAGGGAAGIIKGGAAATRATSSIATAGIGNPIVSTAETGGSILLSVLSIIGGAIMAIIVILIVLGLVYTSFKLFFKRLFKKSKPLVEVPT